MVTRYTSKKLQPSHVFLSVVLSVKLPPIPKVRQRLSKETQDADCWAARAYLRHILLR